MRRCAARSESCLGRSPRTATGRQTVSPERGEPDPTENIRNNRPSPAAFDGRPQGQNWYRPRHDAYHLIAVPVGNEPGDAVPHQIDGRRSAAPPCGVRGGRGERQARTPTGRPHGPRSRPQPGARYRRSGGEHSDARGVLRAGGGPRRFSVSKARSTSSSAAVRSVLAHARSALSIRARPDPGCSAAPGSASTVDGSKITGLSIWKKERGSS